MKSGETLSLRCEDCDIDYEIKYVSKGPALDPDVCPFCGDDIDVDGDDDAEEDEEDEEDEDDEDD